MGSQGLGDVHEIPAFSGMTKLYIRGSSNGRTTGSGPVYWGSNPYPRAIFKKAVFDTAFLNINLDGGDSNGWKRERNLSGSENDSSRDR